MRRVVKIGGSLLLRSDLSRSLDGWFNDQSPAENLVIVGGGELVDSVRRLDQIHDLDLEATHWMCVDLLKVTFSVLCGIKPDWHRIENGEQFADSLASGFGNEVPTLIETSCFFNQNCESPLPADWRTTTDSIAAFLAVLTNADEVVLLKSCEIDDSATLTRWIDEGVVDAAMSTIGRRVNRLRIEMLPNSYQ